MIRLNPTWEEELVRRGLADFEALWGLEARPFKEKKDRAIYALSLAGKRLFLKRYFKISLFGRSEASNEWAAAWALMKAGVQVPRPVAYGEKRKGLKKRAFTLFEAAVGSRLEDLFRGSPLEASRSFPSLLAQFAAHFHREGFSHQDFYLCHFFWDGKELTIIDLQRVRRRLPPKVSWVVKDIAELFYSASEALGSFYPAFRASFIREYQRLFPLASEASFWARVERKREKIARHDAKLKARLSSRRSGRK